MRGPDFQYPSSVPASPGHLLGMVTGFYRTVPRTVRLPREKAWRTCNKQRLCPCWAEPFASADIILGGGDHDDASCAIPLHVEPGDFSDVPELEVVVTAAVLVGQQEGLQRSRHAAGEDGGDAGLGRGRRHGGHGHLRPVGGGVGLTGIQTDGVVPPVHVEVGLGAVQQEGNITELDKVHGVALVVAQDVGVQHDLLAVDLHLLGGGLGGHRGGGLGLPLGIEGAVAGDLVGVEIPGLLAGLVLFWAVFYFILFCFAFF